MRKTIRTVAATILIAPAWVHGQAPEAFQERIPGLMEKAGIPGLSMAWIQEGRVAWTGEFGVASAASGEPVTAETVFEAASLSKPVVAYAAMKLVARGELDLDEPLWSTGGYERLAHDQRAREITPRMVLSHTSGLPNWGGTPLDLNRAPGSGWSYSGEGFVYLATILERETGLPLDSLVGREVFGPLGMESSSFVWRPDYDELAALPHDLIGRPGEKGRPRQANAAASLHTTAGDYGRFLAAVMTGEGLPQGVASEMLSPQAPVDGWGDRVAREHLFWGLGWGIQQGDGEEAIWHWGDNGNFRCFVVAYPETGEGLVYFTNSNNGLSVVGSILDLAFDDTHWSVRFLDYGSWDQPRRQARIRLRRAFVEGDEEQAWRLLRALPSEFTEEVAENETRGLGEFLVGDGSVEPGISVLEWGAERFSTPSVNQALAEARTEAGSYALALAAYETALSLDSALAGSLDPRVAWLREGLSAAENPVPLEPADLEDYLGRYGPRMVTSDGARLLYSREGASSETPLVPLTRDLFGLEGNRTFRIRFDRDPQGRIVAILGLYSDGRTDRTERDPAGS